MRYVVLVAYEPGHWEGADAAVRQEYVDAHHAFEDYVEEHGRRLSSATLSDADLATTIRRDGSADVVTDGPLVELTEQLGGYYDVELPDLDAAIAAAKLLPRAYTLAIRSVVGVGAYDSR